MDRAAAAENVFVLYGALRSGTTLLRLILDAHPDISCPGERDFMLDFLEPDEKNLQLMQEKLAGHRIFRASGLSLPDTRDGERAFWQMLAEDKTRHGGTVHVLVLHRELPLLRQLVPDIRVIHLLRDPRDVARSSIGMGWAGNAWYGVDHWIRTERDWNGHAPPKEQVCTLFYEELLTDPVAELDRLCRFMGLDYHTDMMTFSQTSTYSSINPALAYQWKRKQDPREVSELEYKLGDLLPSRGYACSDSGPRAPGPLRRLSLPIMHKIGLWHHRFSRFGIIDPLLVALGRWGGPRFLSRPARQRIETKKAQTRK